MSGPLSGVKVVELARILAGPWAGQTLADLGADVVKVESPTGDDTRQWGPPFVERPGDTSASYFHSCNRGKKSVRADFRDGDDLAFVKNLIRNADIVIENFKVGGLEKFGLDYKGVQEINSGVIYCSITGFGQDGPYSHRAGYDYIIQGMSGLMSITGDPAGQPQKSGVAITDIFTGLYGVIGILAALHERHATGCGKHIDMALLDVATAVTANQAMNYLTTGEAPQRIGNAHQNLVPYQVFDAADGWIIIATGNDAQFRRLCDVLRVAELGDDPKFRRNSDRIRNRDDLIAKLTKKTRQHTREQLLEMCEAQGIPAGPINDLADVFSDPQIEHRKIRDEIEGIPTVRSPIRFVGEELPLERAAPKLGQHDKEMRGPD